MYSRLSVQICIASHTNDSANKLADVHATPVRKLLHIIPRYCRPSQVCNSISRQQRCHDLCISLYLMFLKIHEASFKSCTEHQVQVCISIADHRQRGQCSHIPVCPQLCSIMHHSGCVQEYEVTDGPGDDGEMFERPAKLFDRCANCNCTSAHVFALQIDCHCASCTASRQYKHAVQAPPSASASGRLHLRPTERLSLPSLPLLTCAPLRHCCCLILCANCTLSGPYANEVAGRAANGGTLPSLSPDNYLASTTTELDAKCTTSCRCRRRTVVTVHITSA